MNQRKCPWKAILVLVTTVLIMKLLKKQYEWLKKELSELRVKHFEQFCQKCDLWVENGCFAGEVNHLKCKVEK